MTALAVPVPNATSVATAFAAPGQLIDYWTRGKGAIKIRWGQDGDFTRCVRALRRYFPKNPEGLCNRLHTRATGSPPGQAHAARTEVFTVTDTITDTDPWDADEASLVPTVKTWSGLLAPLGVPTGDRRRFANALRHRPLPLPLMMQIETDEGHRKSVIVGRILGVEARDGDQGFGMYGHGDFLDAELFPHAAQAVAQLDARVIGPSVDLDDTTYEYRNPDGTAFDEREAYEATERGEKVPLPEFVITDGRIAGATLVNIPAFAEVGLTLGDAPDEDGVMAALMASLAQGCQECDEQRAVLTASAAPVAPPAEAFARPDMAGPTPFTVTDDGRVFGHVAAWESCHVGFPGSCVAPPRSGTDYAFFHTGAVHTAEGDTLPVGRVVVATKHAPLTASVQAASQHYDDTGAVGAYVRAGEDQWGIWVAGVTADDLTPQQLATLRGNPLSGDWRGVGGHLEMVAALSVPVPGFPIARAVTPKFATTPEPFALVAAGTLAPAPAPAYGGVVDVEAVAAVVREQLHVEHEASAILGELDEVRRTTLAHRRDEVFGQLANA